MIGSDIILHGWHSECKWSRKDNHLEICRVQSLPRGGDRKKGCTGFEEFSKKVSKEICLTVMMKQKMMWR
jgi:hypothetical protein